LAAIEKLDAFSSERFPPAGETAPSFKRRLGKAITAVVGPAEELLALKPAPPTPVIEETEAAAGGEASAATAAASGPTISITEPRSIPEAHQAAIAAARYLRQHDPHSPASYLILRGLRWGELLASGDPIDPMALDAPETAVRKRLKTLFLDADYPNLLEAAEEAMGSTAGRGWLDLQHYAIISAEALGPEYGSVVDALRSALRGILEDRPALVSSTLMDDSYAVSPRALEWLKEQGLLPEGHEERRPAVQVSGASTRGAGTARASARRAASIAASGNPERAVELLLENAQREVSPRSRTLTKAEAAAIMLDYGMATAAVPTLEELLQLIDQHGLEQWEEPELVARWIGLLYRCREEVNGQKDAQLMQRIARLDPLEAVAVERAHEQSQMPGEDGGEGEADG
jgi:type VI secretion system protein ImpA